MTRRDPCPRRWWARLPQVVVALLLGAGVLLAMAPAASAHAALVSSDPPAGAALRGSPAEVRLRFSEPVDAPRGAIELVDERRRTIALDAPGRGASATELVASVPPLDDGSYVVVWRVVSADGHPVSAAFAFRVGASSASSADIDPGEPAAGRSTPRSTEIAGIVARAVTALAFAIAAGSVAVASLWWRDAFADRRVRRLLLGAAATSAGGAALLVGLLGCELAGAGPLRLLDPATWGDAAGTAAGARAIVRLAGVVLLGGGIAATAHPARRPRPLPRLPALVLTAVASAGVARAGHGGTGPHEVLGLLAGTVHVAAMALWIGGLALLVCASSEAASGTGRVGRMGPAVSRLAVGCVVALALTGPVLAWREGVALGEPFATGYGQTLGVKVGLVGLVLVGAVRSRRGLRTLRAEPSTSAASMLRSRVLTELVVVAAVLVATARLVNTEPPRVHGVVASVTTTEMQIGPYDVQLSLQRSRADEPALVVRFTADGATPPADGTVQVTLAHDALGDAPISVRLRSDGSGVLRSEGFGLPFGGPWTVTVRVAVGAFDVEQSAVALAVP